MTIEEMDEVNQEYCRSVDCVDCIIRGICDSISGVFAENEEAVKNAYEVLTQYDRKQNVVNHPSHYNQGKYECIDVMVETFGKDATKNFCLLNAFKYIWRTGEKNGLEDIKKARWYLTKYLELEGEIDD